MAEVTRLRETLGGFLPVKAFERVYNFRTDATIQTAFSIATWLFVMGAWVGMAVPFPMGMAASFAGMVMTVAMLALSTRVFTKLGVDQMMGQRAIFGTRGTYVALGMGFVMLLGWLSIPLLMFGRTFNTLMNTWGVGGTWSNPAIWGIVAMFFGIWAISAGPQRLGTFSKIAISVIVTVLISVTVLLFKDKGVAALTVVPPGIFGDPKTDFWFAVELQAGAGTSWYAAMGAYAKLNKSEYQSFWGKTVGWGIMWAVICALPIIVGSTMQMLDPVDWLVPLGGAGWGIAWLVMLVLANVTSAACINFVVASYAKSVFPKLRWNQCIWVCLIVLPLILIPICYDSFQLLCAGTCVLMGGIVATSLVETLMNYKRGWSIRDLYNTGKDSLYYFWKGWNPAAWISIAAGIAFYILCYNPFTYNIKSMWVFTHGGPTLLTLCLCGVLYFLLRLTPMQQHYIRKQKAARDSRTPYA